MNKPAFDPTQPFDSVKPAFDPNAPFTSSAQPQSVDDNAGLNRAAEISQGIQDKVLGPVARVGNAVTRGMSNVAFGTDKPVDWVQKGLGLIGEGSQKLGEAVSGGTGYVAQKAATATGANYVPPASHYASAMAGLAVSQIPQLLMAKYLAGNQSTQGKILQPVVPAERQAAVQAALEEHVPLGRAEMTGGKFITALENKTEKTPLGAIPMGSARADSDAAMQAYLERLQNEMGTPKENFDVGLQAKPAMEARDLAMRKAKDEMFNAVPDNVSIRFPEAKNMASTLVDEQSKLYQGTESPEVMKWAKIVQNAELSSGEGIGGGPEVHGVTTTTDPTNIPGSGKLYKLPDGTWGAAIDKMPTIEPGSPVYGVKHSFSPDSVKGGLPVHPGGTTGEPYALFDHNQFDKSSYMIHGDPNLTGIKTTGNVPIETVRAKGLKVIGKTQKAANLGHEPLDALSDVTSEESAKPNYFAIKKLRENLGDAIGQAKAAGKMQDYRDLTRLKSALDSDIESFANAPSTPLDSMVAQEFKSTYGKANAFSGAYKQLFKGDLASQIESAPPEKVLGMVFQKNNETAIKQFHALVGDEAFQTAKRKWVSDLLQSPNVAQALSEKKIDPGTLNAILSKPEQEALQKYGSVQGIRKTVGSLQGTQGSARSNIGEASWGGLFAGLGAAAAGSPGLAAAGIGQFVAPYAMGKALTSNALRQGINYSISPMTRQAALAAFIDKVTTK